MPAVLLARAKEVRDDGSIVEIVIRELSGPQPPRIEDFRRDVENWR